VLERLKGSHVILREPATKRMTVVPMHPGEFPRPLLQTILKQAGLSVEEFRSFSEAPDRKNPAFPAPNLLVFAALNWQVRAEDRTDLLTHRH
jgi:hypothetical protein